ncbi:MAG TPA: ferric reductase-like transmembrane domain-containing protein [Frankiaceae bacterium]|nr:ferric reductase-like transmembrane domain-containing protein [Frankiaceae bacterium]
MTVAAAGTAHASKLLWYLTRGSGLVCLVLLTASVVLGILTTVRVSGPRWPRFLIAGLHRNISLFVMVVLAFHIAVAVLDSYAPLGWLDAVLPLNSSYRPVWLGLGALSLDLLLAVIVTSLLRARLGHRRWRAVHWASYASWLSAVVHGLGTGSDTKTSWVLVLTIVCVVSVVAALAARLVAGWPAHRRLRLSAGGLAVVSITVLTGWVQAGPLQPGWARVAGTPASLLAKPLAPAAKASGSPAITGPFVDQLSGRLSQSAPDGSGQVKVTLDMTMSGTVPGALSVVITGQPSAGGGVTETGSGVAFTPRGASKVWNGSLTTLDGQRLTCRVRNGSQTLVLRLDLAIDGASGAVSGQLQGQPA